MSAATAIPRRRRWLRRTLFVLSLVLLLLLCLVLGIGATINSPYGRQWLTGQLIGFLNTHSPLQITLEGLRAPELGRWRLQELVVEYDRKPLLQVGQLVLNWRPYPLLDHKLIVEQLTAEFIWLNNPGQGNAEEAEDEPDAKLILPWLQQIQLQQLRIEELQLVGFANPDDPLLPSPLKLRVEGLGDWRDRQHLALSAELKLLQESPTELTLQLLTDDLRQYRLSGNVREPAGGTLGQLLQLPREQPVTADFELSLATGEWLRANIRRLDFNLLEEPIAAQGSVDYNPAEQHLLVHNLDLTVGEQVHQLNGSLQQQKLDFNILVDRFPLRLLQVWVPGLEGGQLSARLQLLGDLTAPQLAGEVQADTHYNALPAELAARFAAQRPELTLQSLSAQLGDARLSGSGTLQWQGLLARLNLSASGIQSSHLRLFNVKLPDDLDFELGSLQGSLDGPLSNPDADLLLQGTGNYRGRDFQLTGQLGKRGWTLTSDDLTLQMDKAELYATGNFNVQTLQGDLRLHARQLPLDLLQLADIELPQSLLASLDSKLRIHGDLRNPAVDGEARLYGSYSEIPFAAQVNGRYSDTHSRAQSLSLSLYDQPLLNGELEWQNQQIQLHLNIPSVTTSIIPTPGWPIPAGEVQAELELTGRLNDPRIDAQFQYNTNIQTWNDDQELVTRPLQWSLQAQQRSGNLQLRSAVILGEEDPQTLEMQLQTEALLESLLQGNLAAIPELPLQLHATGDLELKVLSQLLPDNSQSLSGLASADLKFSGQFAQPLMEGKLELLDLTYNNLSTGTVIDRFNCSLLAVQQRFEVEECKARDGQRGQLRLEGAVELPAEDNRGEVNLLLESKRAALLRKPELEGEISGNLQLVGDFDRLLASGELEVSPFTALLTSNLTHQIPTLEVQEREQEESAAPDNTAMQLPAVALDIRLFADKQAYLRGRGVDAELKGDLNISGTMTEPVYDGRLNTVRGSFTLFGKKFLLERGQVDFNNNAMAILILGIYDRNGRKIQAQLEGVGEEIELNLTSTPAMPEDEILAYLIFGKSIQNMSPVEGLQLAAAINTLRGSGGGFDLLGSTRDLLGADTLYFESAEESEDSDESSGFNVGVGKYINDKVYLELERTPNPSQPWKGRIEIELTPRLNLESSTGGKSGLEGAQLKWKKNYE